MGVAITAPGPTIVSPRSTARTMEECQSLPEGLRRVSQSLRGALPLRTSSFHVVFNATTTNRTCSAVVGRYGGINHTTTGQRKQTFSQPRATVSCGAPSRALGIQGFTWQHSV